MISKQNNHRRSRDDDSQSSSTLRRCPSGRPAEVLCVPIYSVRPSVRLSVCLSKV